MTRVCGLVALWVVCLAAGCGGPASGAKELKSVSPTPPWPVDAVDRVDFWAAPPAAINWDQVPGPDGINARVFLFKADRPDTVLAKGTLEFMMYAGRVRRGTAAPAEPLRVWTFAGDELPAHRVRSLVGWGYATQLGWGEDVPTAAVITLSARYQPVNGPVVYSAPISISMPAKVRAGPVKTVLGDPAAGKRPDESGQGGDGAPPAPVPPQKTD